MGEVEGVPTLAAMRLAGYGKIARAVDGLAVMGYACLLIAWSTVDTATSHETTLWTH